MSILGTQQTLSVQEVAHEGAYLDGAELGDVFLPRNEFTDEPEQGSQVSVFVYLDSDGQPVATCKRPLAQVGDFALLRVKDINRTGAFLDWGLEKDLLVPFNEQKPKMRDGYSYLVRLYLDNASGRICASSNLNKFVGKTPAQYKQGEKVSLIIAGKTDIGFKAIVNEAHWGVLYFNTVFKKLFVGQRLEGYINKVREDDKIDLTLEAPGMAKVDELSERILAELKARNGMLPLGDKSDPEQIKRLFSTSKANYKKAIGGLFKRGLIDIEAKSIRIKE